MAIKNFNVSCLIFALFISQASIELVIHTILELHSIKQPIVVLKMFYTNVPLLAAITQNQYCNRHTKLINVCVRRIRLGSGKIIGSML